MTRDEGALGGSAKKRTITNILPRVGGRDSLCLAVSVVRGMGLRKTVMARTFHEEPRNNFIYMFDAGGC